MSNVRLPLFPLNVVLLPGADLPLHIFEPRYRQMVRECLDTQTQFGMLLALPNGIAGTGCTAEILEVTKRYPDGRCDILTVGRFEMPSRAYLGRFNFKGADQQKMVGQLSGGERGRLHLAQTLLAGGNVLLLDEPSNDLDVETLRALEEALLEFAGSVLVISHDRWFLDRIATHILSFEGDSQAVFFEGNYQEYEADKKKRLGEEGARPHRIRYKALLS